MRYSLSVSLLLGLLVACSASKPVAGSKVPVTPFWTAELMDTVGKNTFRLELSTPKAEITGIYIVKRVDGQWRGTIINEFGVKVLDFVSAPHGCELKNVIPMLDKWYIKRVVASDIRFIMEVDNPAFRPGAGAKRYITGDTLVVDYKGRQELRRSPDGGVKYKNIKRALTYSLTGIESPKQTE